MRAPRAAGRPRDTTIDESAIAATQELLVESGFEATTMQAIAKRAGVHASALYRRWPSRIELIERAVFPGFEPASVEPTGDLRADLRRFLEAYLAAFDSPATRAAMPGLLAHRRAGGSPADPARYLEVSTRPHFVDILHAAPPDLVDPRIDPDDVFDLVLGSILTRFVVPTVAVRNRPIDHTVDLIMRALRPVPMPDRSLTESARSSGRERT